MGMVTPADSPGQSQKDRHQLEILNFPKDTPSPYIDDNMGLCSGKAITGYFDAWLLKSYLVYEKL